MIPVTKSEVRAWKRETSSHVIKPAERAPSKRFTEDESVRRSDEEDAERHNEEAD